MSKNVEVSIVRAIRHASKWQREETNRRGGRPIDNNERNEARHSTDRSIESPPAGFALPPPGLRFPRLVDERLSIPLLLIQEKTEKKVRKLTKCRIGFA